MAKKLEDKVVFLHVDDDAKERMLVELAFDQFASHHIKLVQVSDGDEAIAYLKRENRFADTIKYPSPNIILLDIKMPRVSGLDFLKWLRTESPPPCRLIPVIIISSSGEKKDIERAYALGANTYFVKPIDWHEFRECLKKLGYYWTDAERPNPCS